MCFRYFPSVLWAPALPVSTIEANCSLRALSSVGRKEEKAVQRQPSVVDYATVSSTGQDLAVQLEKLERAVARRYSRRSGQVWMPAGRGFDQGFDQS